MHSKNESITRMKLLPNPRPHFRGGGGKITPEKVGDAPRQFVRICRSFILPLLYSTQSLSRPLSSSRGSYRQFSSSSSSRARAAPTPQRYSKHTQQSSPTLPLQICSHLSSAPPAAAPSPRHQVLCAVGLMIFDSVY